MWPFSDRKGCSGTVRELRSELFLKNGAVDTCIIFEVSNLGGGRLFPILCTDEYAAFCILTVGCTTSLNVIRCC